MNAAATNSCPAASVLLPVFNAERYVAEAIQSVLDQTFTDFELILLDDGSSDQSLSILRSFAARDNRCHVVTGPNRGLIATLNAGIALARGSIVFRMDADDICHKMRFERQASFLAGHPDVVAVGGRITLIDEDGWPICEMFKTESHDAIESDLLSGRAAIAHPAAAIRTDALRSLGGYNADYPHAEDIDLFLRLSEVGKLANLPEHVLQYRQHSRSVGQTHRRTQVASARRATEHALERRGLQTDRLPTPSHHPDQEMGEWSAHQKWAWWALAAGHLPTARKHARLALSKQPFSISNWRLAACVLRGR